MIDKMLVYAPVILIWFTLLALFICGVIAFKTSKTADKIVFAVSVFTSFIIVIFFTISFYNKEGYKITDEYKENKEAYSTLLNNGYNIIGELGSTRSYPSTEPCENPETLKFFNKKYEEVEFIEAKTAICK